MARTKADAKAVAEVAWNHGKGGGAADAAKGEYRPLVWERTDVAGDGLTLMASACTHDDGTPFRFRISTQGKWFFLRESDAELLHIRGKDGGPYPSLDAAQASAEEFDRQAWVEAHAGDSGGGGPKVYPGPASQAFAVASPVLATAEPSPALRGSAVASGAGPGPSSPHTSPAPHADLVMIEIDRIDASHNVRDEGRDRDDPTLLALGESIRDVGLLAPVIVRKLKPGEGGRDRGGKDAWAFRLVGGHRRLAAARAAGETMIEAKLYAGAGVDDAWEARARLAENVQRKDLSHMDLARVFGDVQRAGLTVRQIAEQAHLSDDMVRRHLALLRLAAPVAELVAAGRLPVQHAEVIARVGDADKQIALAGGCLPVRWNEKKAEWTEHPGYGHKDGDPADHLKPMEDLRKDVSYALCGLASAGWLKVESEEGEESPAFHPIEGRGRCLGCPDNTQTAVEAFPPGGLFAGIRPQASDKKGFCTNRPCYEHKGKAWEKIVEKRKAEEDRKQQAAIAKARKAGLAVCGSCGRVAAEGERFKKYLGEKQCATCIKKEEKRQSRGGTTDGYEAKRREGKALAKRFPWTDEQRLAVAQYERAEGILRNIRVAIEAGKVEEVVVLRMLFALFVSGPTALSIEYKLPDEYVQPVQAVIDLFGRAEASVAAMWGCVEMREYAYRPMVAEYDGKVVNVPVGKGLVEGITFLEDLAQAWGVEVPLEPKIEPVATPSGAPVVLATAEPRGAGPGTPLPQSKIENPKSKIPAAGAVARTPADVRKTAARGAIFLGGKRQAMAAIKACTDSAELQAIQALGTLKGDWRRAAVAGRIKDLLKRGTGAGTDVGETEKDSF
jgi:ParB/RepB/Spo0J family partition protein